MSDASTNPANEELKALFRRATPQTMNDWLSALPPAVDAQFELLKQALETVETIDIPPVQAYALLESIRPIVYNKIHTLSTRFLGKTNSLPDQVQIILGKALSLQSLLASSFDNVAIQAAEQGESQAFITGSAIHRAIADKFNLLGHYYLLYLPVPPMLWRRLHELYILAEKDALLGQSLVDKALFQDTTINIKQLYICCMLLGSAGTHRLPASSIPSVIELIKKMAALSKLIDGVKEDCMQLVINLDAASPPQFALNLNSRIDSRLISMDLSKLEPVLNDTNLALQNTAGESISLSESDLSSLRQQWLEGQHRKERRFQPRLDKLQHGTMRNRPSSPDADKEALSAPEAFEAYNTCELMVRQQTPLPHLTVKTLDFSDNGYGLQWPKSCLNDIFVGEIIAIKQNKSQFWQLGEIAWIQQDGDFIKTGVSLISCESIPLVAAIPKQFVNHSEYLKELLPESSDIKDCHVTFLLPQDRLSNEALKPRVSKYANRQGLKLAHPLKEGQSYSQLECKYLLMEK